MKPKANDGVGEQPNTRTAFVEVEFDKDARQFEVYWYDVHNTCLGQKLFRYATSDQRRKAGNSAMMFARTQAPDGVKVRQVNF